MRKRMGEGELWVAERQGQSKMERIGALSPMYSSTFKKLCKQAATRQRGLENEVGRPLLQLGRRELKLSLRLLHPKERNRSMIWSGTGWENIRDQLISIKPGLYQLTGATSKGTERLRSYSEDERPLVVLNEMSWRNTSRRADRTARIMRNCAELIRNASEPSPVALAFADGILLSMGLK